MHTLLARLGPHSLKVELDPHSTTIHLPLGTAPLENGRWGLYTVSKEVGWFNVVNGEICMITPLDGCSSSLFGETPTTWAERLRDKFDDIEVFVQAARSCLCTHCNHNPSAEIHARILRSLNGFATWAQHEAMINFLQVLVDKAEDERTTLGYRSQDEVLADLARLKEILSQIAAITASSNPAAPAAEGEAGGESAPT